MSATPTTPATAERLPRAVKRTLAALIVGGAAAILDTTVVTIALDTLSDDLHSTPATIQWVVTAYLLAVVAAIPLSGWAQATLGGKRAWMASLTVFVVFSAACAFAWSDASLVLFRALQGFGAGMVFPLMQTLALQAVGKASAKKLAATVAAISVPLALGPILGPVLGGVILHGASWRWIFLINVPLVGIGLFLAWRFIAPDARASRVHVRKRFDVVGLALLVPAVVCIVLGLSDVVTADAFLAPDVLVPLSCGVVLLVAFIAWAMRRGHDAAVDILLLRKRSLAASSAVLSIAGASMFAGVFLLPLYWQQLHGEGVLTAALLLVPQGVGALLARVIGGQIAARLGARVLTIGAFAITAAATIPFAFADATTNMWWLGGVLFVRGLGVGAVIMGPLMAAYADVEHDSMPHATMVTRIVQQIGSSIGIALIAVVLQAALSSGVVSGFQTSFWVLVVLTIIGVVPTLLFRRGNLSGGDQPAKG